MTENKKLRFAVVGVGGMGQRHVTAILEAKEAELAALCDPLGQEVLEMWKNSPHYTGHVITAPVYTDFDEMLEKEHLDAIIISSPDVTHCRYTVKALDKGINVMCEKPLCVTDEEAAEMVEAAKKSTGHFFAAHIVRFYPSFTTAKKMIDEGVIGKVYCTEAQYVHGCHEGLPEDNWRKVNPRHATACGGCHAIDIVRYLMGDPDEVFAYGNRFCRTDWVVEDCSETLMHYPDGSIGKVLTTLGCVTEYSMQTVIYGTEGTIKVNNKSDIVWYMTKTSDGPKEIKADEVTRGCLGEVNAMCDEILRGIPAKHAGIEGAKSLLVCNAAIRSISSGNREKLDFSILE